MRLCRLIFAPSVFRLTPVGAGLAFSGEADQPLMKVERVVLNALAKLAQPDN